VRSTSPERWRPRGPGENGIWRRNGSWPRLPHCVSWLQQINIFSNHASRSPRHNGLSETGCAVRIIPCQQSSRTRCIWCECARARPLCHPLRRIPRPRHATGAECCSSLCRIAGEVVLSRQAPGRKAVPRLKPGPRAAPASKLRQAAAPKGCDVRSVMRRDVAKSLNHDHRALHPVLAQDLCGRRLSAST
jgi:hypothetical protein